MRYRELGRTGVSLSVLGVGGEPREGGIAS
jgi:predicted aldo/keto reductase-like oxidoreductase